MNVLKEETARKVFGRLRAAWSSSSLQANQNSTAVKALNDKIAKVAPLVPGTETPAEVNVLTPTALAYITKTYPNSRIIGVTKLSYPSTGQMLYKVELAEGRRPHYTYFDEKGNSCETIRLSAIDAKAASATGGGFFLFRDAASATTCALCCSFAVT